MDAVVTMIAAFLKAIYFYCFSAVVRSGRWGGQSDIDISKAAI
jgi:hypothetical protein